MEYENCNVNWNVERNRAYKQVNTKRWRALLCEAKTKISIVVPVVLVIVCLKARMTCREVQGKNKVRSPVTPLNKISETF